MSLALTSPEKPKRNIIKLHLQYLTSHFWPATETSIHDEIFHRILFPFLLFTKSRQKTVELVWDLIGDRLLNGTESGSTLNWLDGCVALIKTEMAKTEQTDGEELMNQINFSVSSKIAGEFNLSPSQKRPLIEYIPENIVNSKNVTSYIDSVMIKLRDDNSHVRLFGYLIGLELLKKTSGHQQVDIGEQVLSCLGVDELAGVDDLSQEHLSLEVCLLCMSVPLILSICLRSLTIPYLGNMSLRNPTARPPSAGCKLRLSLLSQESLVQLVSFSIGYWNLRR